ncbi:hypothetical protein ACHAWF_013893 [Thalassiosira exigua]
MRTQTPTQKDGDESIQCKLLSAMAMIDPFLRFLTKSTGKTSVPLKLLQAVLPKKGAHEKNKHAAVPSYTELEEILRELSDRGVLSYESTKQTVGFPLPPSPSNSNELENNSSSRILPKPPSKLIGKGLHGSSEPSAKRRMKVLKWSLEKIPPWICRDNKSSVTVDPKANGNNKNQRDNASSKNGSKEASSRTEKKRKRQRDNDPEVDEIDEKLDECAEHRDAYRALDALLSGSNDKNQSAKQWLPCQAAYAGSQPGREVRYGTLSNDTLAKIPSQVLKLFDLDVEGTVRPQQQLFLHQALAIESIVDGIHTVVQTATGSGKSLCFLLPVLAKAVTFLQRGENSVAVLIYPTKALAQDQFTKINKLLQMPGMDGISAGVIDGDTPHSQRDAIAVDCQIILTNPDTLHASILPNWKKRQAYQKLLARISTVVVDEAHVYDGAFGAHVSMVLSRLKRVCRVASSPSNTGIGDAPLQITFVACSATMSHPEQFFRLLCPIGKEERVRVLTSKEDGSPSPVKHFFVWNPPILDVNGNSTGSVFLPKNAQNCTNHGTNTATKAANGDRTTDGSIGKNEFDESNNAREHVEKTDESTHNVARSNEGTVNIPIGKRKRKRRRNTDDSTSTVQQPPAHWQFNPFTRRRHAADETAFVLARSCSAGVRTIAFCKTRSLVEWVYRRTIEILESDSKTKFLSSKIESYRGGYTAEARRSIEERLFQRKLVGVVGTNALELGVDVGGVDLTLHCGYPGSISSLLQQSGRAGRGKVGPNVPSCAIMVAFGSPSEQYIWRNPKCLLSKGIDAPPTLPINSAVMQGHLLCAGEEFPLLGNQPVSCLLNEFGLKEKDICPADCDLLGPPSVYHDNIQHLAKKGLVCCKSVRAGCGHKNSSKSDRFNLPVYSTHPVVKDPWKRVSLRSIEPVSYSIVDLSHHLQGGKTDKLADQAAVLDTIPYSRVFYHAFPGAIIMHRGRRFRIQSMESPPPFVGGASFGPCGSNLLAFAKPTSLQYSTQALSINQITVVKQMEHAEKVREELCQREDGQDQKDAEKNKDQSTDEVISAGVVAGNGLVTVKRTVHGYKKLSHVNRKELSRTTISLPPMEFDTYALWINADAAYLRDVVLNFDGGVHALSHALVAVAPLFVACSSADIDCDHSRYDTTRILLYDQRAGGSGITAQLYRFIDDALKAAVDLLEDCTSCYVKKDYDGGCPACLQAVPCDNFHQGLSRTAGIRVGKHLIKQLENSNLNSLQNGTANRKQSPIKPKNNILIGRASWMENGKERSRWAEVDEL